MALRYFYEEKPNLQVIAAGSFLEFALSDISFPVGRVQSLNMYPMTFLEFLQAKGMEQLAHELRQKPQEFPQAIHTKLLEELKAYFFVGGMPECIKSSINDNSIISAFEVQAEIIHSYRQDFSKYRTAVNPTILHKVAPSISHSGGRAGSVYQTQYA